MPDRQPSDLRPYGEAPTKPASLPGRYEQNWLAASGGIATLVALPLVALSAFGWGFTVGGWMYRLAGLNKLLSLAIVVVSVCFLISRSRAVAVVTVWLGGLGLLVCVIGWLSGVKLIFVVWHLIDTIGIGVVLSAGVLRLLAMRADRPAETPQS
jgi:hypothetical protein